MFRNAAGHNVAPELQSLSQRYTRGEVTRMIGVSRRQLDYWARLGLVRPQARWGERFYSFSDLVALETIKRLTLRRIPARRLRRAIAALQNRLGASRVPLAQLRVLANGSEVVVAPAAPHTPPIEPLTGQFVLDFDVGKLGAKVRALCSRTAEEWFEIGMNCDSNPETLEKAAEAYRHVLELAPDWVEAHINLGTTLYQLTRMDEAKAVLVSAAQLEPANPLVHFNLGCVLEQLGEPDAALLHLKRAVELAPHFADAHLNLALLYDERGEDELARRHLSLYLRYEPHGAWAEFARSRVASRQAAEKITPFRRNA
jgi:tetratricopeptide (TPR) repeat protein